MLVTCHNLTRYNGPEEIKWEFHSREFTSQPEFEKDFAEIMSNTEFDWEPDGDRVIVTSWESNTEGFEWVIVTPNPQDKRIVLDFLATVLQSANSPY